MPDSLDQTNKNKKGKPECSPKRRKFLKQMVVLGAGAALPFKNSKASTLSWEKFFQKHYQEMTPEDKKAVFARIQREIKTDYGRDVTISDPQAIKGVKFTFCLNLSKCNGSRYCVAACVKENNQSRDPQIQFIKVLEMPHGTLNPEKGNLYYEGKSVPQKNKFYIPVQCNQCDNPPCVKVCPVKATWKQEDGIVVIDYDWCIGCRYCQASCPYEARHFNFKTPSIPKDEINPKQAYLSNRIRPKGVMEKCSFCLHRTREGKLPACLEACPTGARKFGNILDENSVISKIFQRKRIFVLKEELNTIPRFFYYFE